MTSRAFIKKQAPKRCAVDLNRLVSKTLSLIDTEIRRHAIEVGLELSEQIPLVWADEVQIEQVLLNLIANAIEAMPGTEHGGRNLVIRTSQDSDGTVKVTVCDSGPGLTPDIQAHLFDAFFTTKPKGLGMGLSISRSIIDVHEGELHGESHPEGPGSTFTFTLPVSKSKV